MQDFIACWFERVRPFFVLRSPGCHSRAYVSLAVPPCAPFQVVTPLDGDEVALVRPYVIAHEQREEVRRRLRGEAFGDVGLVRLYVLAHEHRTGQALVTRHAGSLHGVKLERGAAW